ncbi:hypothetical protein [Bosea sp. PAMC 26642]|uniref:hypothetical protein n=1 Tax=Bosea sp. (strain PAMC 26642) TaxID=1792307 RepID=UPI0012E8CF5A|nr:hypothetical protein [Bosea sp. PAMC 26642]
MTRRLVCAKVLLKGISGPIVDSYIAYADQLSREDCDVPLIVVFEGRRPPESDDPSEYEILDGKARVVRARGLNILLPVIMISKARAKLWGAAPWARKLGERLDAPPHRITGKHFQRSGRATLPFGSRPGDAIMPKRVSQARLSGSKVTNPFAYTMVLSDSGKVRAEAHRRLEVARNSGGKSRNLATGLADAFPDPQKSGPSTPRHQEICLQILFCKLVDFLRKDVADRDGKIFDQLTLLRDWSRTQQIRDLMAISLRLPEPKSKTDRAYRNSEVAAELDKLAIASRAAFRNAGASWTKPLSERLLLFGDGLTPRPVVDADNHSALREHALKLLSWSFLALLRAKHWRQGAISIGRLNSHGEFHKADKLDPTNETCDSARLAHEAVGSVTFQDLTDLGIEQLLILAMHGRFNPFLIWHDMRWAVPLGHWMMAVADLDADRPSHVTVWMAEFCLEQRRRNFGEINHFSGPSTLVMHWLYWIGAKFPDFAASIAEICERTISGFPHLSGRAIRSVTPQGGGPSLVSEPVAPWEDMALQATLFA